MADNVAITAGSGTTIATDDVGGVQYQRVKLDVGGDGVTTPVVGTAAGLPVIGYMPTATGTITTQNLVPAGTATAGSAVELVIGDAGSAAIQVTGTYTGALSLQVTVNGTTWVTVGGTPFLNLNTGGYLATITSALQSVFQVDCGGFARIRVTGLAAVTGTATVTIIGNPAASMVALDAALPAGANVVGAVTQSGTWNVGTVTTVSSSTPVTPTTLFINSAATTNATSVKASAGTVWNLVMTNTNAATRYVKLYNKASAPTVGTDVPVMTIAIPTVATVDISGGANGYRFSTGIALAITTGATDVDATAVAATEVKVALSYT